MQTLAPTLTTDRLTLRAHRASDFDACYDLWTDEAVIAFIGGRKSTRNEVWFRLLRYGGLWPLLGYGYWAIEDRETGDYIGDAGLADFQRVIAPSLDGMPETGWGLRGHAHGRGLATEAMTAILAWADAENIATTCCIIDPSNTASVRVAEKLGYGPHAPAQMGGSDLVIYRRARSA